ncbi:MAG: GtrA family protein [Lysobacteraceae bacterium]
MARRSPGALARFLIVGVTAVCIDYAGYRLCMALGWPIGNAKAAGYIAGAVFGYFANRFFTFRVATAWHWSETARFVGVYLTSLLANVGVNALVLALLGRSEAAIALAFLAATGTSTALNFLGMKFLVFRPRLPAGSATP